VTGEAVATDSRDRPSKLTPRGMEILQLIVDGYSTPEIAARLNLSKRTVAAHRATIMSTLRIHKVAKLVAYALRNGLASML
jgi:DNA-binding NarL/FixJ family response regulator